MSFYLQWKSSLNRQTSATVLNFDALAVALRRFSALVSSALQKDCRRPSSVTIGTYEPYRVNSETCKWGFVVTRRAFALCQLNDKLASSTTPLQRGRCYAPPINIKPQGGGWRADPREFDI